MTAGFPATTVNLSARITGQGTTVVVLHGFTASSATMGGIVGRLEPRHRVITVDLPGHGTTSPPPPGYGMADMVRDLEAVIYRAGGPVHLCGYSMGGRVALSFAVANPQAVRSLALIGTSAGIEDEGARAARARADDALADQMEASDMRTILDTWLATPLLMPGTERGRRAVIESLPARMANDPPSIAAALRALGTGRMPPLGGRLDALTMPLIAIAGELDDKYCEEAREIAGAVGAGRALVVPGAGHAAHLDDPDLVATAISENIAVAEGTRAS